MNKLFGLVLSISTLCLGIYLGKTFFSKSSSNPPVPERPPETSAAAEAEAKLLGLEASLKDCLEQIQAMNKQGEKTCVAESEPTPPKESNEARPSAQPFSGRSLFSRFSVVRKVVNNPKSKKRKSIKKLSHVNNLSGTYRGDVRLVDPTHKKLFGKNAFAKFSFLPVVEKGVFGGAVSLLVETKYKSQFIAFKETTKQGIFGDSYFFRYEADSMLKRAFVLNVSENLKLLINGSKDPDKLSGDVLVWNKKSRKYALFGTFKFIRE